MSSKVVKITWEDLAREELGPGYARAAFGADEGQLICNWLEQGAGSTEPHVHDFDQFMLVVEGSFTMQADGVEHVVEAGELFFIPAGVWHCGTARAEGRTVNFDLFAPPRGDYAYLHQPEE